MTIELLISIIGASVAVIVSILGAIFTNKNNIVLQTRKLKEEHYFNYIKALHDLASNNSDRSITKSYTSERDKLFIIASKEVVTKLIDYENHLIGASQTIHDKYLTELIKAIRKDLKLKNKDFPIVSFKK